MLRSPYPGLRPFNSNEAEIFFGREQQTDDLLRKLNLYRFLAVTGPSGCGKSSLIRAGMIPALETGFMVSAGSLWRIAIMRPGSQPITNLAHALLDGSAIGPDRAAQTSSLEFLSATLRRGPLALTEVLAETPLPERTNLLILVDQFEEIFRFRRLDRGNEADAFVSLLVSSAAQRQLPVYVVVTMRSDYIGDCAVFKGLPEVLNQSQYLTPRLSRDQRRSAILHPARVFGGDVEPELLNTLLNESGVDPNLLPVLQHLLMRMWTWNEQPVPEGECAGTEIHETRTYDEGRLVDARTLTLADFEAVGGFDRALSLHADQAFLQLDPRQQVIAELMFRRMCERGPDRRDVRRPVHVSEITELASAALGDVTPEDVHLVADVFRGPLYGFVVPPCPEPLQADTVLDITHESLIRRWNRLNKWAEQEAQSAETYRYLEKAAQRWRSGRAALWGTPDLEGALEWQHREHPTPAWAARYEGDFRLACAFLTASEEKQRDDAAKADAQRRRELEEAQRALELAEQRAAADAERQRQELEGMQALAKEQAERHREAATAARRLRKRAVLMTGIAIFAVISMLIAFVMQRRAEMRGKMARSRELSSAAMLNIDMDPERSIWLSMHALRYQASPEAWDAIHRAVQTSRAKRTLQAHKGAAYAVEYAPDGRSLVTVGEDGMVRIWDSETGAELPYSYTGHGNSEGRNDVLDVAVSYDGRWIATAALDGTVLLRDTRSRTHRLLHTRHKGPARAVIFSPNGDAVASGGDDGQIIIHPVDGSASKAFAAHERGVLDLAGHPDSGRLVSVGNDEKVKVWDSPGKGKHAELEVDHDDVILSAAFNPSTGGLVTSSFDRSIGVWNLTTRKSERSRLTGHVGDIGRVVFSRAGDRIASASSDTTLKVWDAKKWRELFTLSGHGTSVLGVAFSPDGNTLASTDDRGVLKVWDISPGHTDEVYAVAFSHDGERLATTGRDGTVRIWRVPDLTLIRTIEAHTTGASSVVFSALGIASAGQDGHVRIWDAETGTEIPGLPAQEVRLRTGRFDPTGRLLVTGGFENLIKVWDLSTKREPLVLPHSCMVPSFAFRPTGGRLASACGNTVVFWDSASWKQTEEIGPKHQDVITQVAYSSDGNLLGTAGADSTATIWDVNGQRQIASLRHNGYVASIEFSSDGKLVATASWDRTAKIWEAGSGKLLHTFTHSGMVNGVSFSPNGRYLATACDDNRVHLYPLNPKQLENMARIRLTRKPTRDECAAYFGPEGCPELPVLPVSF